MAVVPTHYLNVYDKPRSGTSFLRRFPMSAYKHRISAMGGFDTASCQIRLNRLDAETIFETYVGNRVAAYVDNPSEPVWEGLISRITLNLPGLTLTRSLDEMANRVDAAYTFGTSVSQPSSGLISATNATSQAIYGIKNRVVRAARGNSGGIGTYPTSLVNQMTAITAYPMSSAAPSGGNVSAIVELEMIGFYHTLDWEPTSYAPATNVVFNTRGSAGVIYNLLLGLLNTTTFFNNADYSGTENNAQTAQTYTDGGTVWQKMQMVAECGDNGTRWIVGITPTTFAGGRRLYYKPANTNVEYIARVNDGARIRTTSGAIVPPWTVQPDNVLRITDALVGWDGDGADPREIYLLDIEYDADSQRVTWGSDDSIEMRGALEVRKWHTFSDQSYGQRASNPMM